MSERTLVCVLGQTRAHELTWDNFETNVLQELNAELAICVGYDETYDRCNPFYRRARHRWFLQEPEDFGTEIDRVCLSLGLPLLWRKLIQVGDGLLGGVKGCSGSGAVQMVFRWFLRDCLLRERLLDKYDRFIVTRSDFLYAVPHPNLQALSNSSIWLPDGEDYGGLVDRHIVANPEDVIESLSMLIDVVSNPMDLYNDLTVYPNRNVEACLHNHFRKTNLLPRLRRMPYFMYSVRGEKDPTRWSTGHFINELGYSVKYPGELSAAMRTRETFKTQADWLTWAQAA